MIAKTERPLLVQHASILRLVEMFELTDNNDDESIPMVRGWIMEELEERSPEAFEEWMLSDDHTKGPRDFFLK